MCELVAGVDYGSDSVRVILVEAKTGRTVSEGVCAYARWKEQKYCDQKRAQYRQHARDYIEGLEIAMREALKVAGENAGERVIGLAIDTTGSTPCPVDKQGTPLCLLLEFEQEPDAMFHLWKDHTAVEEAKEINQVFLKGKIDYTKYQGVYSSEWFWAKILHTTRCNRRIRKAAWTWVEHCDWMAGLLVGNTNPDTISHCSCAAGHKALWHSEFGGLPAKEVLDKLDAYLVDVSKRYIKAPVPAGSFLGNLTPEWAMRLGLGTKVKVGAGSFDAHAGAVGAGVAPRTLVEVIGTSTVELLIEKAEILKGKQLKEYCGQAEDSIVPGYVGLEMSQPAFGDVYAWFKELLMWPITQLNIPERLVSNQQELEQYIEKEILPALEEKAQLCVEDEVTALDWFNGRRYPKLNESVRASICGLGLGTKAPALYCALIKGTVFGCKKIYHSLEENDLIIERIIAVGGIAKKSPFIMQMMSDSLGVPIMVSKQEQICARGAGIYATVAAKVFDGVEKAQQMWCERYEANYFPNESKRDMYEAMYEKYLQVGDMTEHLR